MNKATHILGLITILISCGQQTEKQKMNLSETVLDSTISKITHETTKTQQENTSPYEIELNNALNDRTVKEYFKKIYNQEKLIIADDKEMLTITDSLFTKDTSKDLFYFIVFTKSMNGSDGFYSESVGVSCLEFIKTRTDKFAEYFIFAPKLTEKDMNNWANYIYGEIQISRENEELKAVEELEKQLVENIRLAREEYKIVIGKLIEKIKVLPTTAAKNHWGR